MAFKNVYKLWEKPYKTSYFCWLNTNILYSQDKMGIGERRGEKKKSQTMLKLVKCQALNLKLGRKECSEWDMHMIQ